MTAPSPDNFRLVGYDKDNDVYVTLCSGNDFSHLKQIGTALALYQKNTDAIKNGDKPFDWFLLQDSARKDVLLFAGQCPHGETP